MSRNHYEEAFGVVSLQWRPGEPDPEFGCLYLCEVWRASIDTLGDAKKAQSRVTASLEIHYFKDGTRYAIGYRGGVSVAKPGETRRHARMSSRTWRATIALDGWDR